MSLGTKKLCTSVLNCSLVSGKFWFSGSEGKLSSLNQKLSLLTAIGNLSQNAVSGVSSIETLAQTVAEMLLPLLQEG